MMVDEGKTRGGRTGKIIGAGGVVSVGRGSLRSLPSRSGWPIGARKSAGAGALERSIGRASGATVQ